MTATENNTSIKQRNSSMKELGKNESKSSYDIDKYSTIKPLYNVSAYSNIKGPFDVGGNSRIKHPWHWYDSKIRFRCFKKCQHRAHL